jgi:hypothetical protein
MDLAKYMLGFGDSFGHYHRVLVPSVKIIMYEASEKFRTMQGSFTDTALVQNTMT